MNLQLTSCSHPEVLVSTGRLRGQRVQRTDRFLGIPYAGSVSGRHRFHEAPPPHPWAGTRDALHAPPRAIQPSNPFKFPSDLRDIYPESSQPQAEDCLFLNVWTPRAGDGGKRPVMVWLHGGAFISGVGFTPWTDGARLAATQDVVVISLNHRLGLLGFLYLHELENDGECSSGLLGMLDIIAGLRWIRDNVAEFGGDPNCVTVFGQSGGGAKISALLAMPQAAGLFHRVIVQSGPALRFMSPEDAAGNTRNLLSVLGLKASEYRRLWKLSPDRLVGAQEELRSLQANVPFALRRRVGFNPVVDGQRLPRDPFEPAAPQLSSEIPMLIGTNADEMALFLSHAPWASVTDDDRTVFAAAPKVLGLDPGDANRVMQAYRRASPNMPSGKLLVAAATDACMRLDSLRMAERHIEAGGVAHVYLFNWTTTALEGRLGAAHSLEVPFVFDQLNASSLVGARDGHALAGTMSAAWAAFARTGSPQHVQLPDWPAYDAHRRPTMCFDTAPALELDPLSDQRLAWRLN